MFGAALSAFVVACGDDDSGDVPKTTPEGGSSSSSSSSGGGGNDAGPGGDDGGGNKDGGPKVIPAKLQLVNGATDLGPTDPPAALRVCYKVGVDPNALKWAPLPPLPNRTSAGAPFPGVFAGTGGPVDGTGADLSTLIVEPYVMNAVGLEQRGLGSTVPAKKDKYCEDLLDADAGGAMIAGVDYWKLPQIKAGTFQPEKSYVLILTGCAGNAASGAFKCGAGFADGGAAGNGNLAITIYELDSKTKIDAAKFGAQFIQASPNVEAVLQAQSGGALKVRPAITSDKADATKAKVLTSYDGGAATDVAFLAAKPTDLNQISGVTVATDFFTVNPNVPQFAVALTNVEKLSFGAAASGIYKNGAAWTFIAVGDPTTTQTQDGGAASPFNTKFFHYLALPNDPPTGTFDPNK